MACQHAMGFMPVIMQPMNMDPMLGTCVANVDSTETPKVGRNSRLVTMEKKTKTLKEKQRSRQQQGGKPGSNALKQHAENHVDEDASRKGVVSLFQEFIQCSKRFPVPQHRPILQWSFDSRMSEGATLEFRAQVSFLLEGVAHHVAGSWQSSKREAQRDVAERCLVFFVGGWGAYLRDHGSEKSFTKMNTGTSAKTPIACLEELCSNLTAYGGELPTWSREWDGDRCRAFAELSMLGVPHKFAGDYFSDEESAKTDTAQRVLWYLQASGFEDCFEPDPKSSAITGNHIPLPPANWASPSQECDSIQVAQRKTALMRVQNRLQQIFGRKLKPGQSIWEWSYEEHPEDSSWPAKRCKAKVSIPAAGRSFEGNWAHGQREAQIEACLQVSAFLDSAQCDSPSLSSQKTPSSISLCSMDESQPSYSQKTLSTISLCSMDESQPSYSQKTLSTDSLSSVDESQTSVGDNQPSVCSRSSSEHLAL